jgi:hypothetical protein
MMLPLGTTLPDDAENQWRFQLDEFAKANRPNLAALAWGFRQEWADTDNHLGIDLEPQPHFVSCAKDAVEKLNQRVDSKLQEILGILDGYDPETEVAIIAIAKGQIKLIYFQPDPSPSECFVNAGSDLDSLILELETKLQKTVTLV